MFLRSMLVDGTTDTRDDHLSRNADQDEAHDPRQGIETTMSHETKQIFGKAKTQPSQNGDAKNHHTQDLKLLRTSAEHVHEYCATSQDCRDESG